MVSRELTGIVVEAAVEVHRVLRGPGLLESIYEEALAQELTLRGCDVARQVPVPVSYKGHVLMSPLRIDLLVNGILVVECKAASAYHAIFTTQAVTYLRLTGMSLALVINFGQTSIRQGIKRVVDRLNE